MHVKQGTGCIKETALTSDKRVGWMQAWLEDELHPQPCLHGHMCYFTDSPLTHPNNQSPPTTEPFSPPSPRGYCQCVVLWGLLSSTRLLAVSQPTGHH